MRRCTRLLLLLVIARQIPTALRATGDDRLAVASGPSVAAEPRRVGSFALLDAHGRRHTAGEWRDKRAVVLLFLGTECPVSNGYSPEMARLARIYGPRGVAFFGVHPDPDVGTTAALRHAEEYRLPFPVVLDPSQVVTGQVGVRVTPEAAVVAADGRVLYRGRIDDRHATDGRRRSLPTTRDLEAAIEAVLAGRVPLVAETWAFGCPLPRARPAGATSARADRPEGRTLR